MKKVKDINGNVLRGLFRAPNGTIIIKDDMRFANYSLERTMKIDDKRKIEALEQTVQELTALVQTLLEQK